MPLGFGFDGVSQRAASWSNPPPSWCLEFSQRAAYDMSSLPDIHAPPAQVTKPGEPNTELVEEIAALRKELKVEGDPLKPKLTVPDYPMQPSTASPK